MVRPLLSLLHPDKKVRIKNKKIGFDRKIAHTPWPEGNTSSHPKPVSIMACTFIMGVHMRVQYVHLFRAWNNLNLSWL